MNGIPPSIALDDLDGEMLRRLLSGRLLAFTTGDLCRARWEVLSERSIAARRKASDAMGAYLGEPPRAAPGRPTARRMIRELEEQEARKVAYRRADAAAKRAEAAEERAWRALEACYRGRIVA